MPALMRRVRDRVLDLWAGRLPLADAFWTYNVFWGVLLNLGATITAFAVLVVGKDTRPELAASVSLALHVLPIPYNIVVLVGLWRSAARSAAPAFIKGIARAAGVVLFAVFIFV
ncbi:MAG: hypothetical protein U1E42_10545 [Rhodospirillales bacterium]